MNLENISNFARRNFRIKFIVIGLLVLVMFGFSLMSIDNYFELISEQEKKLIVKEPEAQAKTKDYIDKSLFVCRGTNKYANEEGVQNLEKYVKCD